MGDLNMMFQKQLDLKEGPNSITFSLSTSGAIACTARVFLWDAEDQIVVSDIDGTITKYGCLHYILHELTPPLVGLMRWAMSSP